MGIIDYCVYGGMLALIGAAKVNKYHAGTREKNKRINERRSTREVMTVRIPRTANPRHKIIAVKIITWVAMMLRKVMGHRLWRCLFCETVNEAALPCRKCGFSRKQRRFYTDSPAALPEVPEEDIRYLVGSLLSWPATAHTMQLRSWIFYRDSSPTHMLWTCSSCGTINSNILVCRRCHVPRKPLQIHTTASSSYLLFKNIPSSVVVPAFEKAVWELTAQHVISSLPAGHKPYSLLCCFESQLHADRCLNHLGGGCFKYLGKQIEVTPSKWGHRKAHIAQKTKLSHIKESPLENGDASDIKHAVGTTTQLPQHQPHVMDPSEVIYVKGLPSWVFNDPLISPGDVKDYIEDLCGKRPVRVDKIDMNRQGYTAAVLLQFKGPQAMKTAYNNLFSTQEIKLDVRWTHTRKNQQRRCDPVHTDYLHDKVTAIVRECKSAEVRALKRPSERIKTNMPAKSIWLVHPHEGVHLVCMKSSLIGDSVKDPVAPQECGDAGGEEYQKWLASDRAKPRQNPWTWNYELPYDAPSTHRVARDLLERGAVFNDRTLSALITYTSRQWAGELGQKNYRYLKIPVEVVDDLVNGFTEVLASDKHDLIGLRSYCSMFTAMRDVSPTRWLHLYVRFRQHVESFEKTPCLVAGTDREGLEYRCIYEYRKAINTNKNHAPKMVKVTDHISRVYSRLMSSCGRRHGLQKRQNKKVWETFLPVFPAMLVRDFEQFGFIPSERHKYLLFRAYTDLGTFEKACNMIEWDDRILVPRKDWKVSISDSLVLPGLANATRNEAHLTEFLNLLQAAGVEPCFYTYKNLAYVTKNWWDTPSPELSESFSKLADELTPSTPPENLNALLVSSPPLGICKIGADTTPLGPRSPRYILR
eukprot:TRINITY_DN19289_c0_g1_i1.p1 TRINITY_DN19289_c0_g1~~TRINITY_DN19289_c0_g1_i1.p1  ORF type:complete len:869 (+),score=117.83 TRINITY_DN19289_c0_g1_i1:97-2703(+)